MGNFKNELDAYRADVKWRILSWSQGPSGGLISDYNHVSEVKPDAADKYRNAPDQGSTCELPVYTGGERPLKARTLWKVPSTGEMVPACTKGCMDPYRVGICIHGIPFTERCTDNCVACRKPHRSRPRRFKGDAWTSQAATPTSPKGYDASKCLPPWVVLAQQFPGLQALWETKLAKEDWSQSEQLGLSQAPLTRHDEGVKTKLRAPVYVGFDGEPIPSDGDVYEQKYIARVMPDDSHGDQTEGDTDADSTDRMYYDEHLTIKRNKVSFRETPFWVTNREFTEKFIEWLYPNASTQLEKRKFVRQLIDFYWVSFQDKDAICKVLGLTANGFEQRISRLKVKAQEFYKQR